MAVGVGSVFVGVFVGMAGAPNSGAAAPDTVLAPGAAATGNSDGVTPTALSRVYKAKIKLTVLILAPNIFAAIVCTVPLWIPHG